MDSGRPTLPQRVTAVLHAKQFLVFFAIGLYALDFAVPIASAWLYRREPLVGPFHLRPADRRQFLRLLALELALEVVGALAAGATVLAGDDLLLANAVVLGLLAFYFVVLYADYIIVIADVGPLRAVALSWRTVRATLIPSALILLAVALLGNTATGLLDENVTGSLARAAPMMLMQCVLMGGVVFVADVVLVVLYLNAAETGRLKPKPRTAGDGRML